MSEITEKTYRELFNNAKQDDKNDNFLNTILEDVSLKYKDFNPHVNGYYYIHMEHGTWLDKYNSFQKNNTSKTDANLFNLPKVNVNKFKEIYGTCATDIDIPQLNIDYDIVSGKAKIINYASKIHFAGDFTINYIDDADLTIFKYHAAWQKYIELVRKGYDELAISPSIIGEKDESDIINVPYFNAVYVVLFDQFSNIPQGIIKILGVSPVNLPIKQIIGDRTKSAISTMSQSYKSNDLIYSLFDLKRSSTYKTTNDQLSDDILWDQFINSRK